MTNITSSDDFFAFILINTPIKIISIVSCSICIVLTLLLSYGIIWYNNHASDRNHTLLTKLISSLCYALPEMFIAIQLTEIIREMFGPMSKVFCTMKSIARPMYISQTLLYLDAMAITRYLFIFVLKNPAAFKDDFWIRFINIWIKSASLIGNLVWWLKSEREALNYFICTGQDPTLAFKKPLKVYGFIESASMIIHLLIFIRINIFKRAIMANQVDVQNCLFKSQFLDRINALSLKTFVVNVAGVSVFALLLISSVNMSMIKPEELFNYKNFVHIHYLISIPAPAVIYLFIYYMQHQDLRKFILKNNILSQWLQGIGNS